LSSHAQGKEKLREVFGNSVKIIDYAKAGFDLAKLVKGLFADSNSGSEKNWKGIILMQHGLFTWGATAEESYTKMIDLVTQAETSLKQPTQAESNGIDAQAKYLELLPTLRGALYQVSGKKFLFKLIHDPMTLTALNLKDAKQIFETPPLTPDHLIRTKPWPIFLKDTSLEAITSTIKAFQERYQAYFKKFENGEEPLFDDLPRQILIPRIGAIALGEDERSLTINADILEQSIQTKALIYAQDFTFSPLGEKDLFSMEYRPLQLAKLKLQKEPKNLSGKVALICGAAGAIGSGITHELLESGALVVISDLGGPKLEDFAANFASQFPSQVLSLPIDITNMKSIAEGIKQIQLHWGAIDLLVLNAGLAHVSTLEEMDLEKFQLLERVNIEGTLLLLKAFSKFFKAQATGGDIVLVSTKNVPSPSASFGAYSATKAAGHQLARIASLELAPFDVRVNMVSPDGVFSDAGTVKSGLWALVGPDRMKARGLDEQGLEEYYQNRNLLKTPVTARHVGKAVLYFATRQSPTTGVSLPVDGGLPDATPR
ncbi:MAG: SDR family NAD(P)-dependent oxidoreductase, partial [SAR324 cluster bacterium]|nr:SDR family NAD(P)-dependent oxidoreductase [SAR324 cluster bacterium]